MATVTQLFNTVEGSRRKTVTELAFDSSYPTGGEAITPAQLGFGVGVDWSSTTVKVATGAGVNVANAYHDIATGKVLLYDETPAQVADAADVATVVVQIEAYGH
jgi:hypothetical protein